MARIRVQGADVGFDDPTLVEGFPGVGLVGKIATDHLIDELEMRYYASVDCDGLPRVGVYRGEDPTVRPPVRLYASEEHDLLALRSDAPVPAGSVGELAACLTDWLRDRGATPIYLSGLPADREDTPDLYGIATGDADGLLDRRHVDVPPEDGVVSGPTGALLERAAQIDHGAVGLVVECNPRFPDPEAASVLLDDGIAPIAGVEVDVSDLLDRAAEIRERREALARQMRELGRDESSQAQPLRMYQ
ncbi:proteasome assembly chaperone family protein [Salinilacihabitans rarus]|uniref:proteasome assembly chaperone family protein n=1 Tax=Salinilacihabitans rarus TaxID=2961596 RepID=UPI0020C91359|nr:PAC2 family protein [Salinilacihabitans rarus]